VRDQAARSQQGLDDVHTHSHKRFATLRAVEQNTVSTEKQQQNCQWLHPFNLHTVSCDINTQTTRSYTLVFPCTSQKKPRASALHVDIAWKTAKGGGLTERQEGPTRNVETPHMTPTFLGHALVQGTSLG